MTIDKKIFIITLLLIITGSSLSSIYKLNTHSRFKDYKKINVVINEKKFTLYVDDDPQKRERGLSGIPSLRNDEGMIFLFEKPDYYSFWMKDMKFPLDFIFIRGNEIVDLLENIQPETYPKLFTSKKPADKIIEIKAKEIKKLRIKIGDLVKFF